MSKEKLTTYFASPVIKYFLGVEFSPEAIAILFQLQPFHVVLPTFTQNILHSLHVRCQLTVNLLGPDDGTGHGRQVSDMAHLAGLALWILHFKLVMQRFDVIFHALDELRLVLSDGPANVGTHEEGIEAGENAEHLVGVLCGSQLITEAGRDTGLYAVNAFIVTLHGSFPGFHAFLGHIQAIDLFHVLICQVDLLNSIGISSIEENSGDLHVLRLNSLSGGMLRHSRDLGTKCLKENVSLPFVK